MARDTPNGFLILRWIVQEATSFPQTGRHMGHGNDVPARKMINTLHVSIQQPNANVGKVKHRLGWPD